MKTPKKEPSKDAAELTIRIWTEPGGRLPDDKCDIAEALTTHLEHVAEATARGCMAGEIVDDRFSGWWEITRD